MTNKQDIVDKMQAAKRALIGRWEQFRLAYPRLSTFTKYAGLLAATGLFGLFCLLMLVRFGAFGKIPSQQELAAIQNHAASEVYSADSVLLGKYYIENRKPVDYEDISPDLVNALIATEDARFFEHRGVDIRAWGRVLLKSVLLSRQSSGGGSTISQQLAKNLFPRRRFWLFTIPVNKIKEMYVARRLEKVYTKSELINLYLNTVPFGGNMFGVEVAAEQLFSSTAKSLKTEEAAMLVGMLKANTYYSPLRHPERARQRRNLVLDQMAKYGYLDEQATDSLQQLPLELQYKRESSQEGLATYFREHLRQELDGRLKKHTSPDGAAYNLYTDGLRIYTTIHSKMQTFAEEAVQEHLAKLQKSFDAHWKGRKPWGNDKILYRQMRLTSRYQALKASGRTEEEIIEQFNQPRRMQIFGWDGEEEKEMSPMDSLKHYYSLLNTGFLVMEPGTGDILAWVGGIDFKYFQYDHVKSRRQVGSTFKPIVYAGAIRSGFRPCDYYYNRLVTYTDYEDWQPHNSDGQYGGVYSMEGALSKSVNAVAVDLIVRTGVDSIRQLAHQMGVTSDIPQAPSIALGTADISLFDMLKVYGTIANRGKRPEPRYISRIEDGEGKLILSVDRQPKDFETILSVDQADMVRQLMQTVIDSGTARRLRYQYGIYTPIAGKTGTTQSHADGWFIGFTPRLAAGVWVGGEYPDVRFRSLRLGQGANTALPVWARFMKKVYTDKEFRQYKFDDFPEPELEVVEALDCAPFYENIAMVPDTTDTDDFQTALQDLLGVFKNKDAKKKDKKVNVNPRTIIIEQQKAKEREQIRKKNEKLKKRRKRKKKRKEAWDKLFKKKN